MLGFFRQSLGYSTQSEFKEAGSWASLEYVCFLFALGVG
jgi:hypothetical protein